jgi:hypothetical protein
MAIACGEGSDWCRYRFADRPFLEAVAAVIVGAWVHRAGRCDVVCPHGERVGASPCVAEADLIITPHSGHSPFDPPNSCVLVAATDRFRLQLILWLASFVGAELLACSKSPEPR